MSTSADSLEEVQLSEMSEEGKREQQALMRGNNIKLSLASVNLCADRLDHLCSTARRGASDWVRRYCVYGSAGHCIHLLYGDHLPFLSALRHKGRHKLISFLSLSVGVG